MAVKPERPLPVSTSDTQAYWEAARQGKLLIQRCDSCGVAQFYPREFCVSCLSDDIAWVEASGKGRIYTFTLCHIPGNPAMADKLPYAIAMIDLDEGVRMLTEIIQSSQSHIRVGARVELVFEKLTEELSLPQFTLCSED